ncbi:hypothetical protein CK203_016897 [Vitis vinifera]|uniref:RNase H type-1 domain-containing protein n=1 Tax=Vitis vinifera TaxID=29760 RepID=A0A438JN68_VITVI|nr:hypothetical protein CK203_016897 [Vitis vinifera]
MSGRMLQWAIELSEYGIKYRPKLSMKGQVMTDFVVESPQQLARDGEPNKQAIQLGFLASSNEAEYEAILSGLDLALALSVSKLRIYSDSQLVVRYVQEEYGAKDERMTRYLTKVRDTLQRLGEWTIEKVSQADNVRVDAPNRNNCLASHQRNHILPIYVQTNPSITKAPACNAIEESQEWTGVIKEYLRTGALPE